MPSAIVRALSLIILSSHFYLSNFYGNTNIRNTSIITSGWFPNSKSSKTPNISQYQGEQATRWIEIFHKYIQDKNCISIPSNNIFSFIPINGLSWFRLWVTDLQEDRMFYLPLYFLPSNRYGDINCASLRESQSYFLACQWLNDKWVLVWVVKSYIEWLSSHMRELLEMFDSILYFILLLWLMKITLSFKK